MVRRPASPRAYVTRMQEAVSRSIPAPIGGWDAQSALADMAPDRAVILDNWIPRPAYVEIRRGYASWVNGAAASVQSIIVWRGAASGVDKVFAVAAGDIYDVSTDGEAWPSAAVSGLNSSVFQYVNFGTAGNAYVIAVSGADTPPLYDGSSWSTATISGSAGPITLDPTKLATVMDLKGRLIFTEAETLHVWFLAAGAIQGTAQLLDLSSVFSKGGVLVGCADWTLDGGEGPDDYAVFVTSQGEVAIYQGTDPSDANNWALVGVFALGLPLGSRAILKYGADLAIVTTDGVIPMSRALVIDRAADNAVALTAKIQNAFAQATQTYSGNFGWEGILYPKGSLAIFNIPTAALQSSVQYVQNMQTGAWCRFTGLNAFCWAIANGDILFGAADGVYQWDTGATDNGNSIAADVLPAFNSYGMPGVLKKFTLLRPTLRASTIVQPAVEMLTDFRLTTPTNVPTVVGTPTAVWDSAVWDNASWADPNAIRADWTSVTGHGYFGAPRMQVAVQAAAGSAVYIAVGDGSDIIDATSGNKIIIAPSLGYDVPVQLVGFDVMFEPGGAL